MTRFAGGGATARRREGRSGIDRKRIVILLRSVVIATSAYLVLTDKSVIRIEAVLYVLFFAASNIALALAPRKLFHIPQFGPLLVLADTALILFGLSWSHGLSQDLLLVYFFTIFLTTVGETLGQVAIGSGLIALVYAYWLWASGSQPLHSDVWVRVPFFFLVAIFYASLVEQLKSERHRRREAEHENEHLRLLLDLAGVFSEAHATREFVRGIGRFIEGACLGLRCAIVLRDAEASEEQDGELFPLRAHGREYGTLCVRVAEPRALSERERWLCQMVSHAAAGSLYAAEQSDAARAAAEAKDQFLANVSHEFRTPLHAILGYADMLDAVIEPGFDPVIRESVERLRVNACRLQNLLEELLSFAEIRAGKRAVRVEKLSLREVLEDLLPTARELLSGKAVTLNWQVAANADEVWSDRRKLQRLLACLLSNAAKFTEQGKVSVLATRSLDGSVDVLIADTGIGIAPSDLQFVFDDFRQVDGSFTRRYGGLGVGLALARELITILGGTMDLESQPGVGTTVRVRLPRSIAEPSEQAARPAAESSFEGAPQLATSPGAVASAV